MLVNFMNPSYSNINYTPTAQGINYTVSYTHEYFELKI